jgi:tellurite resistance protein TerC
MEPYMHAPAQSAGSFLFYTLFFLIVLLLIAIDMLALRQRGAQRVGAREALGWSCLWVAISLLFGLGLWWWLARDANLGPALAQQKTLEFFTGYVIEKALAVDNIFVFLLIFSYFGVPHEQQRRVLLYGVLGAIVLRALMVWLGALLVAQFSWMLYVFGAFLLLTGIQMLRAGEQQHSLADNRALNWLRTRLRIAPKGEGERFFVRHQGLRHATPLFLCLLMIELSDVVFAVDSIPAIFAVTQDPFIVLTSNILAILGLRALYFLLADMIARFHKLKFGLAAVLCYIGAKMLLDPWLHIPALWSLLVVFALLGAAILASLLPGRRASP